MQHVAVNLTRNNERTFFLDRKTHSTLDTRHLTVLVKNSGAHPKIQVSSIRHKCDGNTACLGVMTERRASLTGLLHYPSINPATAHAAQKEVGDTVDAVLPAEDASAPKDKVVDVVGRSSPPPPIYLCTTQFYAAYWVYVLLGLGVLYPWNSFLTSLDYFFTVYPDRNIDRMYGITKAHSTPTTNKTRFTIIYFPSNLVLLTACTLFHKRMSLKGRICSGYAMLVLAVMMPVITNYAILGGSLTGTSLTFALVLVGAALAGMGDGLAQGAVFADSSVLPPLYIQAVSVGTAAAGVLIFALRCVTKCTRDHARDHMRISQHYARSGFRRHARGAAQRCHGVLFHRRGHLCSSRCALPGPPAQAAHRALLPQQGMHGDRWACTVYTQVTYSLVGASVEEQADVKELELSDVKGISDDDLVC